MTRRRQFAVAVLFGCLLLGSVSAAHAQRTATGGRETTAAAQSPAADRHETDENEAYRHSLMVQKLGRMFGMRTETAATVFEIANFAVLALLVGGFLARALPKAFRARTGAIQTQLVEARSATEAAGARLAGVEDRLAKLDGQIAEMRLQAERDAVTEEERMRTAVASETAKLLAAADAEIATATTQARRQLQRYAAELAVDGAGLRLHVTPEADRLLVQSFTARLAAGESASGRAAEPAGGVN